MVTRGTGPNHVKDVLPAFETADCLQHKWRHQWHRTTYRIRSWRRGAEERRGGWCDGKGAWAWSAPLRGAARPPWGRRGVGGKGFHEVPATGAPAPVVSASTTPSSAPTRRTPRAAARPRPIPNLKRPASWRTMTAVAGAHLRLNSSSTRRLVGFSNDVWALGATRTPKKSTPLVQFPGSIHI